MSKENLNHLFLAGGGNELQSAPFNNNYVALLEKLGIAKLIYMPTALPPEKFQAAEDWFCSIFSNSKLDIDILTDLSGKKDLLDPEKVSLYIGGGNTARLITEVRESGFDATIEEFVRQGGIVYGGSAGAIILGADIRTAPEVNESNISSYRGLDLLNGYSVACHYKGTEKEINRYTQLSDQLNGSIIAIPEEAGVIVGNNGIAEVIGNAKVIIFRNSQYFRLETPH